MAYTEIDDPTIYFNTVLYTGNGSTNAITGVGFQPDWVWLKERSSTSNHQVGNAVRGATKYIQPNITDAESTDSNRFSSFDSDGFTQGANNGVNESGQTYVAWNWKCETGVSGVTTGGSERSYSGRVNTTAGISIINYAGNLSAGHTIPHHLGVAPRMMIVKNLGDVGNWMVYHASTTDFRYYLKLNSTDTTVQDSAVFDNVPTSSGFLVGSNVDVNDDNQQYLAYCFAEKKGYSRFGSYQGNGSNDGSYIYLGFKPAFVMMKGATVAQNWMIYDTARQSTNEMNIRVKANESDVEDTGNNLDFLSNGFKLRQTFSGNNGSGQSYIYMAFAENPFVTSTGIPTTAR